MVKCRYHCDRAGWTCCFLCTKKCKLHCTKRCSRLRGGRQCVIHYAKKNGMPDPKWRDIPGTIVCVGRGGKSEDGRSRNRNVLVETAEGLVVVPFFNVKYEKESSEGDKSKTV